MTLARDTLDPVLLRHAFGQFPTGVVAICAQVGEERIGFAASSFTCVSLAPPLVGFCVQNTSATWPKLRAAEGIGVSVLGEAHEAAVLALAAKTGDRFAGLPTAAAESGALFVDAAAVHLEASIYEEAPAGDHTFVLLYVHRLTIAPDVDPIVFHRSRFRTLSRG
jgi:flavin reductase (DIM6/NTAB) family NADH-FMN oxidoreductase RutF